MIRGFDPDEYRQLVTAYPPVKIADDMQAAATEARLEALLAKTSLSASERAYADLLSDLLADWEDATVDIPDLPNADLLKHLLEGRGLRQRDLVGVLPTASVVSDVLAGRRQLTREHIESLSRFFHVSPAVFFPGLAAKAEDGPTEREVMAAPSR